MSNTPLTQTLLARRRLPQGLYRAAGACRADDAMPPVPAEFYGHTRGGTRCTRVSAYRDPGPGPGRHGAASCRRRRDRPQFRSGSLVPHLPVPGGRCRSGHHLPSLPDRSPPGLLAVQPRLRALRLPGGAETEKLQELEIPASYWGQTEKKCPRCQHRSRLPPFAAVTAE